MQLSPNDVRESPFSVVETKYDVVGFRPFVHSTIPKVGIAPMYEEQKPSTGNLATFEP